MNTWAYHYRQPFTKQLALCEALQRGLARYGERVEAVQGFEGVRDVDGLLLFGIGGESKSIYDAYKAAGKRIVFFDKGYPRGGYGMYRVAVDDFQPLHYLMGTPRRRDRLDAMGKYVRFLRYEDRKKGEAILFDGASNKYCLWQGLGDWIEWGASVVQRIRQFTDRPIIYRPRPSHNAAVQVPGAELSQGQLADDLARAHVVISFGGNIGWDCVIAGVPHFAMGDSVARVVSETSWDLIDKPFIPHSSLRLQWASNVAYCQWTLEEFAGGLAWETITEQLEQSGSHNPS